MLIHYSLLALAVVVLSSCGTAFTPEQREAMSSVSVQSPVARADAYKQPYGGMPTSGVPTVVAPGNPAAGAVGGALGQLAVEGISASQNQMFKSARESYFPAVQRNTPDPAPLVRDALVQELKKSEFFRPRLVTNGASKIETEILSYGLVRTGKKDDEILLAPRVVSRFILKDSAGKVLAQGIYTGGAESNTVSHFAENPKATLDGYRTAASYAAQQFATMLATRLGDS